MSLRLGKHTNIRKEPFLNFQCLHVVPSKIECFHILLFVCCCPDVAAVVAVAVFAVALAAVAAVAAAAPAAAAGVVVGVPVSCVLFRFWF